MEQITLQPLFSLGQVVATRTVADLLPEAYLLRCLHRYIRGDWGCVCEEDAETNNAGVRAGGRLYPPMRLTRQSL